MVLLLIIFIVLLIGLTIFLIINKVNTDNIRYHFKIGNVIVCGHKGTGKDLVFQWIINKRKQFYYSNISYGGKHKIIKLLDVSVAPNTYDNLIKDNVTKIEHAFKEGKDIYISDGGNFLPSQMDSILHKRFPSMPIYYSLSRHLYNNNVHVNTQNIERIWKALREQADFYITVKRTYKIFGLFITKVYTYDKYESCKANILPLKKRMLNKLSRANVDLYNAQNGDIRKCYIIQTKKRLKYDTRAFEKILLKGRRKK